MDLQYPSPYNTTITKTSQELSEKTNGYVTHVTKLKRKHDAIPEIRREEQRKEVERQEQNALRLQRQNRQQGIEANNNLSVTNYQSTRQDESKRHKPAVDKQGIWEDDGDTDPVFFWTVPPPADYRMMEATKNICRPVAEKEGCDIVWIRCGVHRNSKKNSKLPQPPGLESEQKHDANGPATLADIRQADTKNKYDDYSRITVFMRKKDSRKYEDDYYDMEAYDLQGHLYCSVESNNPGMPIELEAQGPKIAREKQLIFSRARKNERMLIIDDFWWSVRGPSPNKPRVAMHAIVILGGFVTILYIVSAGHVMFPFI